jgi:osmotically-inducible protein OsmY
MKRRTPVWLAAALVVTLSGCFSSAQKGNVSDSALLADIQRKLKAEKNLDLRYVDVDVQSRTIVVSGLVGSWDERRLIEKIVRATPGVEKSLINVSVQK